MSGSVPPPRVLFTYWGRRGAVGRLSLDLARVCRSTALVDATWSIARQNELFPAFEESGVPLLPVTTFESAAGALAGSWRALNARRELADHLHRTRPVAVVNLMPHLWSPLMVRAATRAQARYVTIVHDADAHPGEPTGAMHAWLTREAAAADVVVTLSRAVASRLTASGHVRPDRVRTLFLPDIHYETPRESRARQREPHVPFRLLFFGRVIAYKGIGRVVDAVEQLHRAGVDVRLSVYGEGDLVRYRPRLESLGADVVNRWIAEEDVAGVLDRHDAVVLSHTEASQSGAVAAAFGAGLPVITVPIGGLVEQVEDGRTGIVARGTGGEHLAEAIAALARDHALYNRMCRYIESTRDQRSAERFLSQLLLATGVTSPPAVPGATLLASAASQPSQRQDRHGGSSCPPVA